MNNIYSLLLYYNYYNYYKMDDWWINMKLAQARNADEMSIEPKIEVLTPYIGKHLAKLTVEYCSYITCENEGCTNICPWGICSLDCAMEMSIKPTCSLFR